MIQMNVDLLKKLLIMMRPCHFNKRVQTIRNKHSISNNFFLYIFKVSGVNVKEVHSIR